MQSKSLLIVGLLIALLVAFLYIYNYYNTPEKITLSELQITACNAADQGGTCFTNLPKLDLVSPELCCKALGKCCK